LNDFYFIGQIISIGKDGFVKIQSVLDNFEKYFTAERVLFLDFWGKKKKFIIEETLKVRNSFFVKFLNFDDERDVQVLVGRKIFVSELEKIDLKRNNIQDLIDCAVYKDEILIGSVKDVFKAPANDVIVIIKDNGEELLLPLVDAFFENLDVKNKKLILKSDIGLYDDED
jgi:16S rRNA processing protein RimM